MKLAEKMQFICDKSNLTRGELKLLFDCQKQRIDDLFIPDRVLKLKKQEVDLLALKYKYNPQWLGNDAGDILLEDKDWQILRNQHAISTATKAVKGIGGLSDITQKKLQQIMCGIELNDSSIIESALSSIPDYLMVPKYDIAASAGNGSVINDEAIVDHLAFKREWIKSLGLEAQHIALIDVRGDSMTPTISNGDLILLDTRKGQHLCEGIYAIHLNDGLLVKRIRIKLSGLVEVISDNAQYDTETLTQDKLASLVIIGRVVWHGRRV
ncbi:MAG: S24 family peptidase [Methylotenera sp.]|nr:S24 family peptidase [Methylotenera sp.]